MNLAEIDVGELLSTIGPPVAKVIVLVVIVKIAIRMLLKLIDRTPSKFSQQLTYLGPKIIWGLGGVVIASSLGINISSFLALFATIGVGAALVFTPVGQGLIAGFLAGMDDVVREGDVIEVLGRPGTIVRKGALSVGVELPDGSMTYLPNVKVIDDELVNHNRVDGARLEVEIKLNLDPDRAKAVATMEATLQGLEWRRQDKPTAVHFSEIGSNAFHYKCYAWIDSRLEEPGFKSKMLTSLVDDLETAGISCGETGDLSMANWPAAWNTPTVDLTVDKTTQPSNQFA